VTEEVFKRVLERLNAVGQDRIGVGPEARVATYALVRRRDMPLKIFLAIFFVWFCLAVVFGSRLSR
jgi:hypothetical protein